MGKISIKKVHENKFIIIWWKLYIIPIHLTLDRREFEEFSKLSLRLISQTVTPTRPKATI